MDVAVSQVNRALVRPVTIAAALIGTVQALIWLCLSLISILFYNTVIEIDETLPSTSYQRILYELFLAEDTNILEDERIITPCAFNISMYVYLVVSFVWLLTSLHMLWAMSRNKWSSAVVVVGTWAGVAIVISLLDAVFMSLVVADLVTVQDFFSSSQTTTTTITPATTTTSSTTVPTTTIPTTTTPATTISSTGNSEPTTEGQLLIGASVKDIMYTCYGIVMTLAARGYVLWVVNVVFACVLIKFAYDLKKEVPSLLPMMDAYSTGGRAWNNLYEQTDIGNGYSNEAFKDDSAFPRSGSFISSDSAKNRNPLSNGANPYSTPSEPQTFDTRAPAPTNPNVVNGKVAKIGKRGGRRTPPQNVPPPSVPPPSLPSSNNPYIPDPDYTPPNSPKPKSVLRPKSNRTVL
ncbi:hypothetical protein NQ318_016775 [Aromia moschata]|uniref:Uncharacterized protein n=1 Tax=Aromia moschata TaxID=1265417 RepID=A0AAV8Y382_9CUCU|nr:hypothetical protein NQ318_016775 [Aromia moschata]